MMMMLNVQTHYEMMLSAASPPRPSSPAGYDGPGAGADRLTLADDADPAASPPPAYTVLDVGPRPPPPSAPVPPPRTQTSPTTPDHTRRPPLATTGKLSQTTRPILDISPLHSAICVRC